MSHHVQLKDCTFKSMDQAVYLHSLPLGVGVKMGKGILT
jgi:hypothetical protein